jgi:hypothetical protein
MPDEIISVSINLADIERVARKMNLLPAFIAGIQAGALEVEGVISKYPPSTNANVAGVYPKHWYIRGTGSFWALKGGGVHSKHTSQTLGRKWTIAKLNGGLTASVGNNVSYAPFLHDGPSVAKWAPQRGWLTIQEVARSEAGPVREIVTLSIREEIKKRGLNP